METDQQTADAGQSQPPKHWMKIEEGIRRDRHGYEAYVKLAGIQRAQRFSHRTPIRVMRIWRQQTRAGLMVKYRPSVPVYPLEPIMPKFTATLEKSPEGWCYVYFIQDGENVKIGRATDPIRRLMKLQTAHHRKLTLICAFPGHAVIEAALQQRFAHRKREGEWFQLDAVMIHLIDELNQGKNPIALIWDEKLCTGPAGTLDKHTPN